MDENWPRGQHTMGFKILYDTGIPEVEVHMMISLIEGYC
jgi:hypothetical protein